MTQSFGEDDHIISWKQAFLRDVTHYDRSQLKLFTGIRAGIMVTIPIVIGLLTGYATALASLGVFYLSIPEGIPT